MKEAVIFADAHVGEVDANGAARTEAFLRDVCPSAGRVFILGDLFDFWFGPKQASCPPYSGILDAIAALVRKGSEVTLYHGNRDFYLDEELTGRLGVRLVREHSIEDICGKKVLLCHGDVLCANDVSYHRMRAILRHPLTERMFRMLPAFAARALARFYRTHSKRTVAAKSQKVLGLEKNAVKAHFALGADAIVCGHTHTEEKVWCDTPDGGRELYKLGDFGLEGSYLECDETGFHFRRAAPGSHARGDWRTRCPGGRRAQRRPKSQRAAFPD